MRKFVFKSEDEFGIAVGLGLIEGVNGFVLQGYTPPLAADLETDITTVPLTEMDQVTVPGQATVYFPSNDGEPMEIVSSNPADTGNVRIYPLGPGALFVEPIIVTLNGVTPVPLPAEYSRINFMQNIHPAGILGTVTIRAAGGGRTFINMLATYQQSTQARYTIPAGKKGLLKTAIGSMRKQTGTDTAIAIVIRNKPFDFARYYHPFGFGLQRRGTTTVPLADPYPEALSGPVDVSLSATASAAGAEASGRIAGLIIDI